MMSSVRVADLTWLDCPTFPWAGLLAMSPLSDPLVGYICPGAQGGKLLPRDGGIDDHPYPISDMRKFRKSEKARGLGYKAIQL
jgi:hypothetical protein